MGTSGLAAGAWVLLVGTAAPALPRCTKLIASQVREALSKDLKPDGW